MRSRTIASAHRRLTQALSGAAVVVLMLAALLACTSPREQEKGQVNSTCDDGTFTVDHGDTVRLFLGSQRPNEFVEDVTVQVVGPAARFRVDKTNKQKSSIEIEVTPLDVDGPDREERFTVHLSAAMSLEGKVRTVPFECALVVAHRAVALPAIASPLVVVTSPPAVVTSPPAVLTSPPAVVTSPPAVVTSPPAVVTSPPAVVTSPPAVVTSPPAQAPAAPPVTSYYRTYTTSATLPRDDCGYSPGQATITITGNADGSSVTITVRLPRPPDANPRTYTGTIKPDGTFSATGSGVIQPSASSNWTGSISGRVSGGTITATETVQLAANSWCTTGQRTIVYQHTGS